MFNLISFQTENAFFWYTFIYFVIIVTSHENSGNARGSLSSVGSDSPNPCNDNDGEWFFHNFFHSFLHSMLISFECVFCNYNSFGLVGFICICLSLFVWEEKSNRNTENRIMISTFIQNDAHLRYLFNFKFYLRVFQRCDFGMFFPQLRYILFSLYFSFFGVQMNETTLNANLIFFNAFFYIQLFMTRIFFSLNCEFWSLHMIYTYI